MPPLYLGETQGNGVTPRNVPGHHFKCQFQLKTKENVGEWGAGYGRFPGHRFDL